MQNDLKHYGVVGMHWGIRRYQNEDGSLTTEGKIHYGIGVKEDSHDSKKANDIYNTLSYDEKIHLTGNAYDKDPKPDEKYEYDDENYVKASAYSLILSMKDVPVSVLDVYRHGEKGVVAIAVRNDKNYRGIGLAKESTARALKWFEENPEIMQLDWAAFADNYPSQKLAEEMGFIYNEADSDDKVKIYSKYKNNFQGGAKNA